MIRALHNGCGKKDQGTLHEWIVEKMRIIEWLQASALNDTLMAVPHAMINIAIWR